MLDILHLVDGKLQRTGYMKKSEVVNYFGGVCNVARAIGIKHPSVSEWGEIIPERAALKLEKLTCGKLKYDSSLYGSTSGMETPHK